MGKMEMSTVLKNLKFMQRAAQKEEKIKKDEESTPDGNFTAPSNVSRKCVVILEGDPQPGTVRGRISFLNFNPSIDKLREDDADNNGHAAEASTSSVFQSWRGNERNIKPSEHTGIETSKNNSNGKLKRKYPKEFSQTSCTKKQQKNSQGKKQQCLNGNHNSDKQPKSDKLDF